ncbi:MAG: Uma2 family endonuclease [Planctomycetota bacterium]|nr:Uma2 family endonuclease [Planctomycetota bacterium]
MTATALPQAAPHILLKGISWGTYQRLLEELDSSNLRLTYDRGRLEIMAPLPIHESIKKIAARIIETYALEADIAIYPLGSTTFRREDLEKGLEPDECYYIANAAAVEGKDTLDLTIDPPPDLALEIDNKQRSIKREPIYAALGVPEIWRHDGSKFAYLRRDMNGVYTPLEKSLAFPNFPAADFNRFLNLARRGPQHDALKALRDWVRS